MNYKFISCVHGINSTRFIGRGSRLIRKMWFMCSTRNCFFFFNSWGRITRRPLVGLLYQFWILINDVGYILEWELAVETDVLREIVPQCHSMHHVSHKTWPEIELGRRSGKLATVLLRCSTANSFYNLESTFLSVGKALNTVVVIFPPKLPACIR
jgi:hypothetical protein